MFLRSRMHTSREVRGALGIGAGATTGAEAGPRRTHSNNDHSGTTNTAKSWTWTKHHHRHQLHHQHTEAIRLRDVSLSLSSSSSSSCSSMPGVLFTFPSSPSSVPISMLSTSSCLSLLDLGLLSSFPVQLNPATIGAAVAVVSAIAGGINWALTRAERQRRTYIRNIVEGLSLPFHAASPRYGPFFKRVLETPQLGHTDWQRYMLHRCNGDIYHAFHGATGAGDSLALRAALHGRTDVVWVSLDGACDDRAVCARMADALHYHGGVRDVSCPMDELLWCFSVACEQRLDVINTSSTSYRKVVVIVQDIAACLVNAETPNNHNRDLNNASKQLAAGLLRLYDRGLINVIYDVPFHGVELLRHVSGHSRLTSSPYPAISLRYLAQQLRCILVKRQAQPQPLTQPQPLDPDATPIPPEMRVEELVPVRNSIPVRDWSFLSSPLHAIPSGYDLVFHHFPDVDHVISRLGPHMTHLVTVLYGMVEDGIPLQDVLSSIISSSCGVLYSVCLCHPTCLVSSIDRATFILVTHRILDLLCCVEGEGTTPGHIRWDAVHTLTQTTTTRTHEQEQEQEQEQQQHTEQQQHDTWLPMDGAQVYATVDRLVQLEILRFLSPMTVGLADVRFKWAYRELVRSDPAVIRKYQWATQQHTLPSQANT